MSFERSRNLSRLHDAALALPVEERTRFLDEACAGDEALRRELDAILALAAPSRELPGPPITETSALDRAVDETASRGDDFEIETVLGRTLSHYKILNHIGSGGMGDVYKAEDTRLGRVVALKLMVRGLSKEPSHKRRFIQEARAASALDHSNICTIHDIGESEDGRLFLVMTLYDGETLAGPIRRGPMPIERVTSIAQQIAAGLTRAHEYGIVHRDIKPRNLFVTKFGDVKILDFGLAKLRGEMSETGTGMRLGTIPYMSPEQVLGTPIDHRSDIWSLGVVLYEMLTSRRPFEGNNPAAISHAIVFDEPPRVTDLRPETPALIGDLVDQALAKSPETRIASCADISRRLVGHSRLAPIAEAGALAAHARRSIMVMPFASLGGDSESEYFGHGLSDEIITDLSRIDSLRVIARTAAERVRASGRNLREVARELGVEYVVDGAVRRQGRSLRISANLVEGRTGSLLWAEQFSGSLEDIFAIQQELSRKIVDALRLRLSVAERALLTENPLTDFEAYAYYLKAKQEFVRYAPGGLERALNYIEAARARVGDNELLLAAAGQIYWQLVNSGSSSDRRYLDKTRACAERILQLSSDSAHGHRLLGMVRLLEGDIRGSLALLEKSAQKNPNDTDTLSLLAPCWGYAGWPQAGVPYVNRLLELDPVTPMYQCMPGFLALMAGSFDEALAPFAASYQLDRANPLVSLCYGQCLTLNDRVGDAIEIFDELQRMFADTFLARLGQLYKCALLGRPQDTRRWLTADVVSIAHWDLYHAWNLAECYTLLGDTENAVKWVARAAERGLLNYPLLSKLDPLLEPLRSLASFQEIMVRVREQWEELNSRSNSGAITSRTDSVSARPRQPDDPR